MRQRKAATRPVGHVMQLRALEHSWMPPCLTPRHLCSTAPNANLQDAQTAQSSPALRARTVCAHLNEPNSLHASAEHTRRTYVDSLQGSRQGHARFSSQFMPVPLPLLPHRYCPFAVMYVSHRTTPWRRTTDTPVPSRRPTWRTRRLRVAAPRMPDPSAPVPP